MLTLRRLPHSIRRAALVRPTLAAFCVTSLAALSEGCSGRGDEASERSEERLEGARAQTGDGGVDGDAGLARGLVLSQVFTGGGLEGAPFKRDFVEIFNRSTEPQVLTGLSLQFATDTGPFPWVVDGGPTGRLVFPRDADGTNIEVPPGGYISVGLGGDATGAGGEFRFDFALTLGPNALELPLAAGKVALVRGAQPLSCGTNDSRCPAERIVDMIGWGDSASDYEGAAPAGALGASKAAGRGGKGCEDTNDNQYDFAAGAPAPRNGETSPEYCGSAPPANAAGEGHENAAWKGLVISQVFGGGGMQGAPFKRDYVEIFNASKEPRVLTGLSLQYAGSRAAFVPDENENGSINSVIAFPKAKDGADLVLVSGAYFLVVIGGEDDGEGAELDGNMIVKASPTALDLDPQAGKVALVREAAPLKCGTAAKRCGRDRIIDLVGYGAEASDHEGSGRAPSPSATKAALRKEQGCKDSSDNAKDFIAGKAEPRTTISKTKVCGVAPKAIGTNEDVETDEEPGQAAPLSPSPSHSPLAASSAARCSFAPPATSAALEVPLFISLTILALRRRRSRTSADSERD